MQGKQYTCFVASTRPRQPSTPKRRPTPAQTRTAQRSINTTAKPATPAIPSASAIEKQRFSEDPVRQQVSRRPRAPSSPSSSRGPWKKKKILLGFSRSPEEMPMGKYGAYAEMLDTAVRITVHFYTHCPPTSRLYYRPPPTTTATSNGAENGNGRSSAGEAEASSARRNSQQQRHAAVRAALDATEIMLSGGL